MELKTGWKGTECTGPNSSHHRTAKLQVLHQHPSFSQEDRVWPASNAIPDMCRLSQNLIV